jgi:retron-type reverse transcriptase
VEKSFTVNAKVYIAFVDLLKAFDNVNWNVMMKILKMIKIDYRDRIIRELYGHQTTSIKIKGSKRETAIRKGVRQGCKLSPLLFNIYTEQVINKFKGHCT